MINVILSKMLRLFNKSQKKLFFISLLHIFMSAMIMILCGAVPLLGLCIVLIMTAGLRNVFLSAYQRQKISTEMLFEGFDNIKHICKGMLWMFFKTAIWLFIPVIGIFFAVAKAYEYRFVPYILMTRPDIKAMDALDVSSKETDGFKTNMLYIDTIIWSVIIVTELLLWGLSRIPIVGVVFAAAMIALAVIALLCIPFIRGIISASFYYEATNHNIHPAKRPVICPCCMSKTDGDGQFCSNCGEKLVGLR